MRSKDMVKLVKEQQLEYISSPREAGLAPGDEVYCIMKREGCMGRNNSYFGYVSGRCTVRDPNNIEFPTGMRCYVADWHDDSYSLYVSKLTRRAADYGL